MDNFLMNTIIQPDVFAGLSAVLAYWLWVVTYGTGKFVYIHRYRYKHWMTISDQERADACLNLGCFFFFGYAALQRSLATWDIAHSKWKLNTITSLIAPAYLPFALAGMSLFIWWLCYNSHYPNYRRWWCNYMWTGTALFAIILNII